MKAAKSNFDTKEVENLVTRKFPENIVIMAYHWLLDQFPKLDFELPELMKQMEKNIYVQSVYQLRTAVKKEEEAAMVPRTTTTLMKRTRPAKTNKDRKRMKVDEPVASSNSKPLPSSSTSTPTAEKAFACLFCDKQHKSTDCHTYSTLEQWNKRLADLKRCGRVLQAYMGLVL